MKDNANCSNVKVYIEQKALDLLESCQNPDEKTQQIFYLLGREYHLGLQRVFVIRTILEGSVQDDTALTVSPEELRSVDQQRSQQYPNLRLIGWALHQPGHGVKALSRHSRCHVQYFRQTALLLLQDSKTSKKDFYIWNGSVFQNAGNYLIYQEQELDLDMSNENSPVELWSEPVTFSTKDDDGSMLARALRDNPASSTPLHLISEEAPHVRHYTQKEASPFFTSRTKEPRQFEGKLQSILDSAPVLHRKDDSSEGNLRNLSLLTSISAIVLLITVITGALMFHNISTLSAIQTHIETINHRISYIEQSEVVIEEPAEE